MNILYVGKFFPCATYKSLMTEMIARDLRQCGNKVFLLSDAWCTVYEDEFCGNVLSLSDKGPFEKKYYIDPLQKRIRSKERISCMLGLACKIIEFEKIDCIIFSDSAEYLPVLELVKVRYNLPIFYALFDDNFITMILDDYIHPFAEYALSSFNGIFTDPFLADFLVNQLHINPNIIHKTVPVRGIKNVSVKDDNILYILLNKYNCEHIETVLSQFNSLVMDSVILKVATIDENPISQNRDYDMIPMNRIPSGAMIASEDLLTLNTPSYGFVLFALSKGFCPMINSTYENCIILNGEQTKKYGKLSLITELNIDYRPFFDLVHVDLV